MRTCAVISCDSSPSNGVTIFRIPRDDVEAKGWIDFVTEVNSGIPPNIKSGSLYVCVKHFRKCCIYPCNTITRCFRPIPGHYPSVIDGKVFLNARSKCEIISADENLTIYTPPIYRTVHEQQRAYLVQQLTSFNVQRKIVIGRRRTNSLSGGAFRNLCEGKEVLSGQESSSSVSEYPNDESFDQYASSSTDGESTTFRPREMPSLDNPIKVESDGELSSHPMSLLKEDPVVSVTNTRQKRPTRTRPTVETKMKLLLRDNVNLKKMVGTMEKKMKKMEKDLKKFKYATNDVEKRYKRLIKEFQSKN